MENSSFIKLDRNILKWEWYHDANTTRMFIHLLLKANWKDTKYCGVDIPRGSLVTTYPMLSEETGLTIQQSRTAIAHLKSTGEITVNQQPKFSVVAITNYDRYQATNSQDNSQSTVNQQATNSLGEKEREEKESTREKVDIEKDLIRNKEEEEYKNIYNNNSHTNNKYIYNNISAQSEDKDNHSLSETKFLLKDGTYYVVDDEEIKTYETLFPDLDIRLEIKKMANWCIANPRKRKTRGGAATFITGWLQRSSDGYGKSGNNNYRQQELSDLEAWANE